MIEKYIVNNTTKKLDHINDIFSVVGFFRKIQDGRIINIDITKNRKRLQKKKYCLAKFKLPPPPPIDEKKFVVGNALVWCGVASIESICCINVFRLLSILSIISYDNRINFF
jgi:hypothetical protein